MSPQQMQQMQQQMSLWGGPHAQVPPMAQQPFGGFGAPAQMPGQMAGQMAGQMLGGMQGGMQGYNVRPMGGMPAGMQGGMQGGMAAHMGHEHQAAALQMMHYAGMGVPMAPAGMHGLYGMPQPLEPAPQP